MAARINAGQIIAQFVITTEKATAGARKAVGIVTNMQRRVLASMVSISQGLDRVGGRMVEQAERFTFLAGALLGGITLGFKDFANKNEEARSKIKELSEQIKAVPLVQFAKKQAMQAEITRLLMVEQQTRKAAQANKVLTKAFTAVKFEVTKTIAEAILPYVRTIVQAVKTGIAWLEANRETVKTFVVLAAKAGLLFAALAPVFAIGGKLIRVFALMASPVGLIGGALFLLYKTVEFLFGPAIKNLIVDLVELWKQFREGLISASALGSALVDILFKAFKSAADSLLTRVDQFLGNDFVDSMLKNGLFDALKDNKKINEMADAFTSFFKSALEQVFKNLSGFILEGLFGEGFKNYIESVKPFAGAAKAGLANTSATDILGGGVGPFFSGPDRLSGLFDAFKNIPLGNASGIGAGGLSAVVNVYGDANPSRIKDAVEEGIRNAARDMSR